MRAALVPLVALAAAACDAPVPAPAPAQPSFPAAAAAREAPSAPSPPPMTAGHARMVAILRAIRDRAPEDNVYQCDGKVRALERELAALPAGAPAPARFRLLFELGETLVLLGREREGIPLLEEAEALRPACRGFVKPLLLDEAVLRLGSAWLRVGETENCCARNSPGSCILPLAGPALHERPEGSRKATEVFLRLLADPAAGEFAKRQATWLLNIAAMTLGEYPGGVPEEHRVPPAYFAGEEEFPHFPNVARKLGLDFENLAGSVVAEDFDDDGDLDILVSNFDPAGQLRYVRNEGDGTFAERTEAAGLTGLLSGLNMAQADYDGDGRVDVLVLRGAWLSKTGRHPKSLLRNLGGGVFSDVTFDVGLGVADYPSQTAAWADFDGDGDLDLYVGNEQEQGLVSPCQLFRNDAGRFAEVGEAAGVTNHGFTKGVVAADFDGDRLPDLYVSNLGQPNRLYLNRGNWRFEDVAEARGVAAPRNGFPVFAFDYDNDGATDILAWPFYVTIADLAAVARGLPCEADTPHLYRGDGKGGFTDVTKSVRLERPCSPMGANFGDLDNDGFLDLYLGTGTPMTRAIMPNLMFRNRGGRDFADVTLPGGFGHLQKGHGIAFADLDDDGDLDVFEQMGGAYRGDKFRDALYESPGFAGTHWLGVRCVGTKSNCSAIGARIRAEIVEDGARRSVFRTVGSGGSFGANPLRQHLGLGKASKVETLEVFWPTTGTTQTFRDVGADQVVTVTEGKAELVTRKLAAKRSGAGK